MNETTQARRPDKTYSKHIMLTEFGREKIEAWAKANRINFSAAIETLALLGLDDERSSYAIPALRATTLQGIRLSFNRIARLLSDIAVESAVARTMAEGIMLQLVREQAAASPDDFENRMRVSRGGRSPLDARIRAHLADITSHVEQAAIERIKKPVAQVENLLVTGEEAG
ncbi:MAG: hypothetical protein IPM53_03770 [Anaerolineaceae bacterium]|nr:hypothetical protein [Anaerolineaceae bacterium]